MINILVAALVAAVEQELIKASPAIQQAIAAQLQALATMAYDYINPKQEHKEDDHGVR